MKNQGRLKPMTPHVPQTGTKIPQALTPPVMPNTPPLPNSPQVNMIGNPKQQKFQKMKKMLGVV